MSDHDRISSNQESILDMWRKGMTHAMNAIDKGYPQVARDTLRLLGAFHPEYDFPEFPIIPDLPVAQQAAPPASPGVGEPIPSISFNTALRGGVEASANPGVGEQADLKLETLLDALWREIGGDAPGKKDDCYPQWRAHLRPLVAKSRRLKEFLAAVNRYRLRQITAHELDAVYDEISGGK